MKKKDINSIDINAKTLNGQEASYYDPASIGLKETLPIPEGSDCNLLLSTGFYTINASTANSALKDWAILFVIRRSGYNAIQQIISLSSTKPRMFFRALTSAGWSPWKEVATL